MLKTVKKETTPLRTFVGVTIAAAVMSAASMTSAVAGSLVTKWSYDLNSGFFDFVPAGNIVASDPNAVLGMGFPTTIAWGDTDDPKSSFEIDPATDGNVSGMIMTTEMGDPLSFEMGNTFIHNNEQIFDEPFLSFTRLRDKLTLTPLEAFDHDNMPVDVGTLPQPLEPPVLDFDLFFLETLNEGPCDLVGPPMGDDCSDVVAVDPTNGVMISLINGDILLTQMFAYEGHLYNGHIKLSGLEFLDTVYGDGTCEAAGSSDGCVGVVSPEDGSNEFIAMLAIEHKGKIPVPEPGALALFGLGLAGLGFIRRRRTA